MKTLRKTKKTNTVALTTEAMERLDSYLERKHLPPSKKDAVSTAVSEWLDREEAGK